jgi:hypothetical protein
VLNEHSGGLIAIAAVHISNLLWEIVLSDKLFSISVMLINIMFTMLAGTCLLLYRFADI